VVCHPTNTPCRLSFWVVQSFQFCVSPHLAVGLKKFQKLLFEKIGAAKNGPGNGGA